MSSAEERIAANVAQWTQTNAEFTDAAAERSWRDPELELGRLRHSGASVHR